MKKRIMIDMDEVICEGGFLFLINEFLGTSYKKENFTEFLQQDVIPIEKKDNFFEFLQTQNIYDHCYMIENAREVIKKLNKEYDVYIGTSYIFPEIINKSGFLLNQKFNYLIKELPFLDPYKFVFLGEKQVLNCEIKIDDKPINLEKAEQKLLFKTYHNKNITKEELELNNLILVDGWLEIEKILLNGEK